MITMTYQGGTTVLLKTGKQSVIVHAENGYVQKENEIVLLEAPEEKPALRTISWPGEYDIDGVSVCGIGHDEGASVSYMVEIEGVHFAFLDSPLKDWSDSQIEFLGDIDVLCVPSDNPKALQKIIDDIDPRVLIPLNTGGAEKYAETLKVCGAQGKEAVHAFDVKKGSLPTEGRDIVVLTPQK
ncbi:MAG: hypothetical protein PHU04_03310 [Candidatus Peribacteraceae bacterium]|nr:hypothetical protein [Candidatus Peribacteraceae bacterium]